MYEGMLQNYRVWFEGLPDPVFYKSFYPMGGNDSQWLWDIFNYARGLKIDKDPDERWFSRWREVYEGDVRALLNTVMGDHPHSLRGVVVIPSSKKDVTNRATRIVREVLRGNPRPFVDLTRVVRRVADKDAQHDGGKRFLRDNVDTMRVFNHALISSFNAIVVIDDILTSGTSFRAMGEVLRRAGFRGTIYNFAFARTAPVEGVRNILNHDPGLRLEGFDSVNELPRCRPAKKYAVGYGFSVVDEDGNQYNFSDKCYVRKKARYTKQATGNGAFRAVYDPTIVLGLENGVTITFDDPEDVKKSLRNMKYRPEIDGIVFDFDQTLLDDNPRKVSFEEDGLGGRNGQVLMRGQLPYGLYEGVDELMALRIPFAIVSNRPESQLIPLVRSYEVESVLYPDRYLEKEPGEPDRFINIAYHGDDVGRQTIMARLGQLHLPKNVFSFPMTEGDDGYSCKLYKPCTQGVDRATAFLRDTFDLLEENARFVGVGNTYEDMVAYNTAGIESCLALWGVPEYLRKYASEHWGADHIFATVADFTQWCKDGGPF